MAASNPWFKVGLIGSIVAAICCFTPVLVVTLGVIGLGALTGYLDYVLLPALGVFLGLTLYGWYRGRKEICEVCPPGLGNQGAQGGSEPSSRASEAPEPSPTGRVSSGKLRR